MNSEKPGSADVPRRKTTDRGLIQPDAGPASLVDEQNDAAGIDPRNDPEEMFNPDEEAKLGDRQIIIANRSAG
ncbi:hypothetical protein ACE1B6_26750 [Aerosakkonemataceae cyanobacterium BLCC-F154]|uniref:Uncharacterized protein n=1 Tax=Floridaenema fluviatile BLCC-F154 TaxID=3153640 RepID=A0ABV4YJL1_9CYAN